MGLLARYRIENKNDISQQCINATDEWITSLGKRDDKVIHSERNGDIEYIRNEQKVNDSYLVSYNLKHHLPKGIFEIDASILRQNNQTIINYDFVGVSNTLEITPFTFDVRPPKIFEQYFYLNDNWIIGESRLIDTIQVNTTSEAENIISLINDQNRSYPLIVVSDPIKKYKELRKYLGNRIRFLGVVAFLNSEESEYLFNQVMGYEHGCFNNAIRIYKPKYQIDDSKYRHPLWTSQRIDAVGELQIENKIRRILQKYSLDITSYPVEVTQMKEKSIAELREKLSILLKDKNEYHELFDIQTQINTELEQEIQTLKKEINRLEAMVGGLRRKLENYTQEEEKISIEQIETVDDAFDYCKQEFSKLIFFGESISEGIKKLKPEAGPPEKIIRSVKALYELAIQIFVNNESTNPKAYLLSQNVKCSGEDEKDRNTKESQQKRSFKDINGFSIFEDHIKVSDGTSPDRCVRIYYRIDTNKKKIIIGWIGPHP